MATASPKLQQEQPSNFASDLAGMPSFLIDPGRAAPYVHHKWFWVGPLVVFSIASIIAGIMMMPIVQHVLEVAPLPDGVTSEQYQKGVAISVIVQKVALFCAPLTVAIVFAIQAGVLLAASSVLAVQAKFGQLFNLVAGCGLIQMIAAIAGVAVLKLKGDISTRAELRPAMGIDIFLPEGTNRFLAGFLGYFSVFELWWIVMMVLIFALAFRVTKGKAFAVIAPLIALNIIWRIAAAAFQR
jgi:hypothetical protein